MLHIAKLSLTLALIMTCTASAFGEEAAKDAVSLDVNGEGVKKVVANQTQIGYSSTRIFYSLASRNVIVVVHIDNKNNKFPVDAKVYEFAKGVTEEDLGKWVNNQHSDGLFPEIPEPVATHQLKADSFKTVSSKKVGQEQSGPDNVTYDKYTVEFEAGKIEVTKKMTLAAFKDSVTVYMLAPAVK